MTNVVKGKLRNPVTQITESGTSGKFSGKSEVGIACNSIECFDTRLSAGAFGRNFTTSGEHRHGYLENLTLVEQGQTRANNTFVENYESCNISPPRLSDQLDAFSVLPLRVKAKPQPTPKDHSSTISGYSNKDNSRLPSFSIPSSATKLFLSLNSERELKTSLSSSREQSFSEERFLSRISAVDSKESLDGRNQLNCINNPMLARLSSSSSTSPSCPLSPCSSSSSETFAFQDWCRESLTPRFNHLRAVLEGRLEDPPAMPPIDHPDIQAAQSKSALQVCHLRTSKHPLSHCSFFKASSAVIGRDSEMPTTRLPVRVASLSHAPVNSSSQSHDVHCTVLHKPPLRELHSGDISVRTPRIVLEDVSECYAERQVQGQARIKHCTSGEWLSDRKVKMNVL